MKPPQLLPPLSGSRLRPCCLGRGEGGFSLVDSLIAMGACGMVMAGLVLGAVALHRSFAASDQYAGAQNSQLRVMDYLTRDLRRASKVYPVADSAQISLEIPDYYDKYDSAGSPILHPDPTVGSNPRDPAISTGTAIFGPNPLIITYYRDPTSMSLMRQVDWKVAGVAKQSRTIIADGVQNFETKFQNYGTVVQASVTFLPIFQKNAQAAAREGTTLNAAVTLRNAQL